MLVYRIVGGMKIAVPNLYWIATSSFKILLIISGKLTNIICISALMHFKLGVELIPST